LTLRGPLLLQHPQHKGWSHIAMPLPLLRHHREQLLLSLPSMAVSKIRYTSLLLHLSWLLMAHALLVCSAAVHVLTVLHCNHCKSKHCKAVPLQEQLIPYTFFGISALLSACLPSVLHVLHWRLACFAHHSGGLISHLSKRPWLIIGTPGLSCMTHIQDVCCMAPTCCAAVCRLMKPICSLGLHMTLCPSCNPWDTRISGRPVRERRRWSSSNGLSSSPGQPLLPPDPPCSRCPHCLLITLWLTCLLQSMAHLFCKFCRYPACLPPVVAIPLLETHEH